MKKKTVNQKLLDNVILKLIDRINSFNVDEIGMLIIKEDNRSFETVTIRHPGKIKEALLNDRGAYDVQYAFSRLMPDVYKLIYNALKGDPVHIQLDCDLSDNFSYAVVCAIVPDLGILSLTIGKEDRRECYEDTENPRIFGDFLVPEPF